MSWLQPRQPLDRLSVRRVVPIGLVGLWSLVPGTVSFLNPQELNGQDQVQAASTEPPWGGGGALREELRLGSVQSDPKELFGDVQGVAVTEAGEIWVADGPSSLIRIFDAAGNHVRNLGGRGSGPGEFTRLMGIARLPDDRIAAWDPGAGRLSIFSPNGALLSDAMIPTTRIVLGHAETLRSDAQGYLYIRSRLRHAPSNTDRTAWVKVSDRGAVLDTLWLPDSDIEGPQFAGPVYPLGKMYAYPIRTISALGANGRLVVGRNSAYTITVPLQRGSRNITREYRPVRVKPEERAERQRLEEFYANARGVTGGIARVPDSKPPFWAIWADETGRLWVARHREGEHLEGAEARPNAGQAPDLAWVEALTFDVFAPSGDWLGDVTFPRPETSLHVARGRLVWVVEEGEFGEKYVVRYRITD